MPSHADEIRLRLAAGPLPASQLALALGVSQPSVSRALAGMDDEIVRIGAARSIQYALRDRVRELPDIAVFRVGTDGRIMLLGTLVPVRPCGFVIQRAGRAALHSDSLPWWLFDMRPQGYLGRAFAARHAGSMGLPERPGDWNDAQVLRVLLAHGHDLVGNLLLGDASRDRFLAKDPAAPIALNHKAEAYVRLAREAGRGEMPGSSAGGEQPKFTAFIQTKAGPSHAIVKFSEIEAGPVSQRWRDLLLAEHIALGVLREAGIPAASTQIVDHGKQRFLEVERFDRIGELGRRGLFSLTALDAQFTGLAAAGWPTIVRRLAAHGYVDGQACDVVDILWAFGTLIGNTDMHNGNLSFIAADGRPHDLAPAYDMTPMAFAPRSGGGLPDTLAEAGIHASVGNSGWRQARQLATIFLARVMADARFSDRFKPCISALAQHIEAAGVKIERLG